MQQFYGHRPRSRRLYEQHFPTPGLLVPRGALQPYERLWRHAELT